MADFVALEGKKAMSERRSRYRGLGPRHVLVSQHANDARLCERVTFVECDHPAGGERGRGRTALKHVWWTPVRRRTGTPRGLCRTLPSAQPGPHVPLRIPLAP